VLLIGSTAILALSLAGAASAVPIGPSFPPTGGTVDFAFTGGPTAADAGGVDVEFTNFTEVSGWIDLWWFEVSALEVHAFVLGVLVFRALDHLEGPAVGVITRLSILVASAGVVLGSMLMYLVILPDPFGAMACAILAIAVGLMAMMKVLRTPASQFDNLPDLDFEPA